MDEKELLLKDLSARLSYGVKIMYEGWDSDMDCEFTTIETLKGIDDKFIYTIWDKTGDKEKHCISVLNWKPFLRPMSSMTEKEREEWADIFNKPLIELDKYSDKDAEEIAPQMFAMSHLSSINWLYSKHFNIILPKEAFIEVTEENNPYKE